MSSPPTGTPYVLTRGPARAVVTEVGATLRAYDVSGVALLDGFEAGERVVGGRGQVLLPWPNRVADGRWSWEGTALQLALTEPDRHCAIHGLVRWAPWRLVAQRPEAVVLEHVLPAQPGWPFVLRCQVGYALGADGLTVTTQVTNVGDQPAPLAAGAHPYLSAGGGVVDDCEVEVPADRYLPTDERGLPTGEEPVEGTSFDLRRPGRIGERVIDVAYTALRRDPDGRVRVRLRRPDGSVVVLWAGPEFGYLQVFSGDTLPGPLRRRGLAVEPMTAPPNALATGRDLQVLAPEETVTLTWGIGPA